MRLRAVLGVAAIAAAAMVVPWLATAQPGTGTAPKGTLNTLIEVRDAIRGCWKWPPLAEVRQGMELTIRLSFKRNGEIFGARLTYETPNVSNDERRMYYGVLLEALKLCSPLPVSESLGAAIAGRPFSFRFKDTRREGKA